MQSLRKTSIFILAAFAALPCVAERRGVDYAVIGQDALARQILRAVSRPNTGIQHFAALGSGQGIKLETAREAQPLPEFRDAISDGSGIRYDASAGLKPHAGLLPKTPTAAKGRKIKAAAQLKKLRKQGLAQDWGETPKRDESIAPRKDAPRP